MAMPVKACAAPIWPPNQMRTGPTTATIDGEEQAADATTAIRFIAAGVASVPKRCRSTVRTEQLQEEQRHAARPQPLMHGLLQIDRNHA